MWITTVREGDYGPLYEDLGRGYPSSLGFYVFTDRGGDRIERGVDQLDGGLVPVSIGCDYLLDGVVGFADAKDDIRYLDGAFHRLEAQGKETRIGFRGGCDLELASQHPNIGQEPRAFAVSAPPSLMT